MKVINKNNKLNNLLNSFNYFAISDSDKAVYTGTSAAFIQFKWLINPEYIDGDGTKEHPIAIKQQKLTTTKGFVKVKVDSRGFIVDGEEEFSSDVFPSRIGLKSGSVSQLAVSFRNQLNSGVYKSAAKELTLLSKGFRVFSLTDTSMVFYSKILCKNSTVDQLAISFKRDSDTGVFCDSSVGNLSFVCGGVEGFNVSDNVVTSLVSICPNKNNIRSIFFGDKNTGFTPGLSYKYSIVSNNKNAIVMDMSRALFKQSVYVPIGSSTDLPICFMNMLNTGMFFTNFSINFVVDGVTALSLDSKAFFYKNLILAGYGDLLIFKFANVTQQISVVSASNINIFTCGVIANGNFAIETVGFQSKIIFSANSYVTCLGCRLMSLADPVNPGDVVTKKYFDNSVQGNVQSADRLVLLPGSLDNLSLSYSSDISTGLFLDSEGSINILTQKHVALILRSQGLVVKTTNGIVIQSPDKNGCFANFTQLNGSIQGCISVNALDSLKSMVVKTNLLTGATKKLGSGDIVIAPEGESVLTVGFSRALITAPIYVSAFDNQIALYFTPDANNLIQKTIGFNFVDDSLSSFSSVAFVNSSNTLNFKCADTTRTFKLKPNKGVVNLNANQIADVGYAKNYGDPVSRSQMTYFSAPLNCYSKYSFGSIQWNAGVVMFYPGYRPFVLDQYKSVLSPDLAVFTNSITFKKYPNAFYINYKDYKNASSFRFNMQVEHYFVISRITNKNASYPTDIVFTCNDMFYGAMSGRWWNQNNVQKTIHGGDNGNCEHYMAIAVPNDIYMSYSMSLTSNAYVVGFW